MYKMNLQKTIRYILSGYIFERKAILKSLLQPNGFIPSKNSYKLPRIAVYTVSTGGYDQIREPKYVDEGIDYFVFTKSKIKQNSVWKVLDVGQECQNMTPLEQARFVKTHPHLYFKDYDISIFIDGNIQILKDIKPLIFTMMDAHKKIAIHRHNYRDCIFDEARIIWAQGRAKIKDILSQVLCYKREGFPRHFGLFETNVIIRFHNDQKCIEVMETWWNEINNRTKRDQLSFTYALWKNGLSSNFVMSLGNCSRNSEYFSIVSHK